MTGTLYLIPNTLGDEDRESQLPAVLPHYTQHRAAQLRHWIVENAKTARALLKSIHATVPLVCPLQEMHMVEWRGKEKDSQQTNLKELLKPLLAGHDMGLMSEAGLPAIADPGADIVQIAHQLGIRVVPLVGPSSLLLALMSSGLNGQQFAFHGYLPVNSGEKIQALKQLEQESKRKHQTQLWIETPYRNPAMVESILTALADSTRVCIAVDLTLPSEWVRTYTISTWKQHLQKESDLAQRLKQRPAVFLMLS